MALRTFSLLAYNWAGMGWAFAGPILSCADPVSSRRHPLVLPSSGRAGRLAQLYAIVPTVGFVAAALDPAGFARWIDQPGQRYRRHFHLCREFRLLHSRCTLNLGQHRPLRAGDAVTGRLLVGIGAHK